MTRSSTTANPACTSHSAGGRGSAATERDAESADAERELCDDADVEAEAVNSILALQKMACVEGAIEVHSMMAPVM